MKKRFFLILIMSIFAIGIVLPSMTSPVAAQNKIVLKSGWKVIKGAAYPGVPYHANPPSKVLFFGQHQQ